METVYGIKYTKPEVILLQETGLGVPEMAARTCYDSFNASENDCIPRLNNAIEAEDLTAASHYLGEVNNIEHSELLDTLAWTHFHHSILEHTNLSFLIKGTSRGVLQEHARHRIQAISVRSTRYTMSGIINAYTASKYYYGKGLTFFTDKLLEMDMFVTTDKEYQKTEIAGIFDKLVYQNNILGTDEFNKIAVAKSSLEYLDGNISADDLFDKLQNGKKKRNVGDAFKHIVTDNWKVDMIVTMNLRGLKNYFGLRDSGAAFFQIQWLAKAMKEVTPSKYLDLIVKNKDK
jgi:thymidylate synthase (FAD)